MSELNGQVCSNIINEPLLDSLKQQNLLRPVDYHFAQWLALQQSKLNYKTSEANQVLAALISQQLGDGHICIRQTQLLDLCAHWPDPLKQQAHSVLADIQPDGFILGNGEQVTPLVADRGRFYLYRYWQDECYVAAWLKAKSSTTREQIYHSSGLEAQLDALFPPVLSPDETTKVDWQRVAAKTAATQAIAIISGGPGTGKTTTVAKMLAVFLQQWCAAASNNPESFQRPIIQLTAPTGKAAARLGESISSAMQTLPLDDSIRDMMPNEGTTLHRLLGANPTDSSYRYNADNPLHLDLVIVDEASMIDLPLMTALLKALPPHARLVLMGDRHQLASVEAGSVMGDICTGDSSQVIVELKHSYRFDEHSGIGALAKAINAGNTRQIHDVLTANYADLSVVNSHEKDNNDLIEHMWQKYRHFFHSLCSPKEALQAFSQFQILCAVRKGVWGVEGLNQAFEKCLGAKGIAPSNSRWYAGRAVMVTRNAPAMGLFNGDIGVTLVDPETGQLKVYFELGNDIKAFSTSRLPTHETVFAMTVHKSQGSEFDEVTLVVGRKAGGSQRSDATSKILSRELVYTGVTRAKTHCRLYGDLKVVLEASARPTVRMSGLADRLWG